MATNFEQLAAAVGEEYDADIVIYLGPVARPHDDFLIGECATRKKGKNVVLCVATNGGDAHPAYRIARTLQKNYCATGGKFYAFAMSACASAGTLLVTGADELILSDHTELGPVDPQLKRQDEVGERTSGLTPVQALEYLREEGVNLFSQHFASMRFAWAFPTSLASRVAAEVTAGCLGKLYEQIDPLRVAEINRILLLAEHYGKKIQRNLKEGALERLVKTYPAHDFVIDRIEAKELFEHISDPKPNLAKFGQLLKEKAGNLLSGSSANVIFLPKDTNESDSKSPKRTDAGSEAGVQNSNQSMAESTKGLHGRTS